ncbi:MAG: ankyrin repeat domain-containing protein [Rickettsiales bacterium]
MLTSEQISKCLKARTYKPIEDQIKQGQNLINNMSDALRQMVVDGDVVAVRWLIDHGADINKLNKNKKNALEIAKQRGNAAIIKLLEEALLMQNNSVIERDIEVEDSINNEVKAEGSIEISKEDSEKQDKKIDKVSSETLSKQHHEDAENHIVSEKESIYLDKSNESGDAALDVALKDPINNDIGAEDNQIEENEGWETIWSHVFSDIKKPTKNSKRSAIRKKNKKLLSDNKLLTKKIPDNQIDTENTIEKESKKVSKDAVKKQNEDTKKASSGTKVTKTKMTPMEQYNEMVAARLAKKKSTALDNNNKGVNADLHVVEKEELKQDPEALEKNKINPSHDEERDENALHLAEQGENYVDADELLQEIFDLEQDDIQVEGNQFEQNEPCSLDGEEWEEWKSILDREFPFNNGDDINHLNREGQLVLNVEEQREDATIIELLMKVHANMNAQRIPQIADNIEQAVETEEDQQINHEVEAEVEVEVNQIEQNELNLHDAVRAGNIHAIEFLINNGADIDLADQEGNNALQIAEHLDAVEVIELLRDYIARITSKKKIIFNEDTPKLEKKDEDDQDPSSTGVESVIGSHSNNIVLNTKDSDQESRIDKVYITTTTDNLTSMSSAKIILSEPYAQTEVIAKAVMVISALYCGSYYISGSSHMLSELGSSFSSSLSGVLDLNHLIDI